MTERAGCWSITINNPTDLDLKPDLPAGWKLTGQMEKGAEGTEHYQGMLTTPQVRFSAVKKVLPRAHIEAARNRAALAKYVHKEDSRTSAVADVRSEIPTLFAYQTTVASRFDEAKLVDKYNERLAAWAAAPSAAAKPPDLDEMAMDYLDSLVAEDIRSGVRGAEFIAINPMWRSSWKKFWRSIIARDGVSSQRSQDASSSQQTTGPPPSGASCSEGSAERSSVSGDDSTEQHHDSC